MQEDAPQRNIFHQAQKDIYLIMENDSMQRFLQSDMSKVVIKHFRRSTLFSRIKRFRCKLQAMFFTEQLRQSS